VSNPVHNVIDLIKLTKSTVRTILNRQRWNAGFSIITEANTNGGMRVSASASKNVRSIVNRGREQSAINDSLVYDLNFARRLFLCMFATHTYKGFLKS